MGGGAQRHRVAIFGGGRVGTAMSLEMPGVPVIRRGQDCDCDVACICWPAQSIKDFSAHHPIGARATKVSFCNGVWSVDDGADHSGICYVRAVNLGDRAKAGRKGWRVGRSDVVSALRGSGLEVVESRSDHLGHLWSKALYILPLALACDCTVEGKLAATTEAYAEWYDVVRQAAVAAIGEEAVAHHEPRVRFLVDRTPRGWIPSSSPDEVAYFRSRLCAV